MPDTADINMPELINSAELADIEFVDTDTQKLVNTLIQGYEHLTKRTLSPADPVRLFILWVADIMIQLNVNINFSAKMNLPRFAKLSSDKSFLDSLGELFRDTTRLQADYASTTLKFTISAAQLSAVIIPRGTRATPDGVIQFAITEEIIIPAGELSGNAHAVCLTVGAIGNDFLPGQINKIVASDVFPFFQNVANITESGGGSDEEDNESYYERMRLSLESWSTAGPTGAYEYWAKTASALIGDVRPVSPNPGDAKILVLLKNGELPDAEILNKVYETLTDDRVRPFTDNVSVAAPDPVYYDIDFTYFLNRPGTASSDVIDSAVRKAVDDFKTWQSARIGRDINPSRLHEFLMRTGIKRVEIRSPLFTVIDDESGVAISSGTVNIVNGGYENE